MSRAMQIYISFKTIVTKEVVRFLRIWSQTLLPSVITMTLYFVIFGKLIGSQINNISGYTYMQYIVPGLVMMSIMTNAYANTASSFFGAKFTKSIEEILVAPVPNYVIVFGFMIGGTLRGLLVGMMVTLIALLFTHLHVAHVSIVVLMAILSSMLFSLAGLVNGIFAKKFDDVSFIPTFVLTPLTYLGGVFYSIKQLPPLWRKFSVLNPILSMVDTFRYGVLGVSDVNIYFGFGTVCLLFVALLFFGIILLQKGVGIKT